MDNTEYQMIYCPHLSAEKYYAETEIELDANSKLCLCKFCANQIKLHMIQELMPAAPSVQYFPVPAQPRWGY